MCWPGGRGSNRSAQGSPVPGVSRSETKLWFYFVAGSCIDIGCEAIHYGQAELMNGNDPELDHWADVLTQARVTRRNTRGDISFCVTRMCLTEDWFATAGYSSIFIPSRCGSRRFPTNRSRRSCA